MKVYVLGNAERAGVAEEVARRLPLLREHVEILLVDLRQEVDLSSQPAADVALVFGGDGAILRAARQMAYRQIPVLGVNLGRLGFLADIHPQDFDACFLHVLQQTYRVTEHLMFECVIARPSPVGQPFQADSQAGKPDLLRGAQDEVVARKVLGLNEVVVHALPPLRMLDLELEVDGVAVSRFGGDGLIVSSPIGSTAHNLSAGGPILAQELSAFVITPICPHTLTHRPIVESAQRTFSIHLGRGAARALVVVDGQSIAEVGAHERITIRKAPVTFRLVKVPGHGYYQTLRDKLRWGAPPSYRSEP